MNEVGFKSVSAAGFNKDIITKQFNNQYTIIPDTAYMNTNSYKVTNTTETKEVVYLRKAVNRLERNISFIQHEHSQMLLDLQAQVNRLREENQALQFQLVMRSGRMSDNEIDANINPHHSEHRILKDNNSESTANQILKLREALADEKARNDDLVQKLALLTMEKEDIRQGNQDLEKISNHGSICQIKKSDEIDISSNIRISLDPLTVSLFHEDSGQYITNTSPSVEDCELIIKTLLEKSQYPLIKESRESSLRSTSAQISAVPCIKRPLQNIKPIARNSAPIKFNPLHGTLSSRQMGLTSSHQKLTPIISHKHDIMKLEEESHRLDTSMKSEMDNKHGSVPSIIGDIKNGCSLPALPKPNDYNRAEKQRRLHLLQRKRLDQYNNKL